MVVTGIGDLLGFPKAAITNFVIRKVTKMVPAYSLPGAVRFNDALAKGASLELDPVDVSGEDVAFLQYTGGTTGVSKGAVLTHRNMVANTLQVVAFMPELAEFKNPAVITALPLYHIFALTTNMLVFTRRRRQQRADHEPARHAGLRQGAREGEVHLHHRRQHAVQRAAQHAGLRRRSTSAR